jgi:hypothetical protein
MCGEDDANIPELVRFLLDIYAPKNTINSTWLADFEEAKKRPAWL